uniref:methylenetetrahydrofolate reductase (NADPH) n=1 Tax=Plectus sambesii TaxID=2011161 RepID=A0A914W6R0_9BILA
MAANFDQSDDVDMTISPELEMAHENGATDQTVGIKRMNSQTFPYSGNYEMNGKSTENGAYRNGNAKELLRPLSQECNYVPLHKRIQKRINAGDPFFSLEFFPPKTTQGVVNFFNRVERLREGGPMFVDVTWHMGSDPANLNKETSSSSIAAGCLDFCRVDTMLHITCAQYTKEQTMKNLEQCKEMGIRNLLALRGDLPQQDENPIVYKYRALDMIRWTVEQFGDYFTIAASGYPMGHPEAPSYAADLQYLKSKVDAGAQFIITQLFFEEAVFEKFVRDCREIGITVPIIPGIMPIGGYENIRRIAELSKLTIPDWLLNALEPIKQNDEAVRNYGIHLATQLCRNLLNKKTAPSVHIYTMNRESACREILQNLGLWQQTSIRALPWVPHGGHHPIRCREDVRPIFWAARPKSYIYRTKDWDEFPNGRLGNISSPAFGDLKDYYLFYLKGQTTKEDQLKMYGHELQSIEDVQKVFVNFLTQQENENGVKVTKLPWNEQENTQEETRLINEQLLWCNNNGIITINSQPAVNGAPSTDPLVGWGQPGGYCYQKAYLEFFTSRENAEALHTLLPAYKRINYHIINHDASIDWTNSAPTTPIAVTWGVFPGQEIAQPTVVDPLSFRVWK